MSRHDRAHSRAEVSRETTENLYELGLLSRPKEKPRPGTSTATQNLHYQNSASKAREEPSMNRLGSSSSSSSTRRPSFKQQSISAGTLGRPYTPTNTRQNVRRPSKEQIVPPSPSPSAPVPGRPMARLPNADQTGSRRERTFVGSECAACEELLEHTLRGERILQFSCGHVAHEACFYEYIRDLDAQYCPSCDAPLGLDTLRGGSVLDLNKLTSIVRSVVPKDASPRSSQTTPIAWDRQQLRSDGMNKTDSFSRGAPDHENEDHRNVPRHHMDQFANPNHSRNDSGNTSSGEYTSEQNGPSRKHDYDLHAMETSVRGSHLRNTRNAIPYPIVTVRSEFPTLNRSRQQQSITCLVTIEVPEGKWHPQFDDFSGAPPVPPIPSDALHSQSPRSVKIQLPGPTPYESDEVLDEVTGELRMRVENWHGLEFQRFGPLRLFGAIRVGKDGQSWQELECYLFGEMLICVKEKKSAQPAPVNQAGRKLSRCTLKGSILIKKHLKQVQARADQNILTLNLSVSELPTFHLQFQDRNQLEQWQMALLALHAPANQIRPQHEYEQDNSGTDDDEYSRTQNLRRAPSVASSYGHTKSVTTAPTEYSSSRNMGDRRVPGSIHIPVDVVVVIPVSSSMQGLKITLLRDTLRFLVSNLGDRDRMGLVTFGSSGGGVPLVGMTTKVWAGWNKVLSSIRPVGQKSLRADVVEGANVAMDLLMQRKASNPISTILLISDSSTSDTESVDFVVQRAEAAKVGIYSFGLGLTHRPDSMLELSSRTKANYTYVKDWMMLRECLAGCLGALQSTSHQNVKLRLKLPEGSPAKFVKISGALQTTKRATGRDAEASMGDLHFGDKRDILVQLAIEPDHSSHDAAPQDAWESIVSGLEALGGSMDTEDQRSQSVEEVPLLQADLAFGDLLRDGTMMHLPRPSLLAITMLPAATKSKNSTRPATPPIPPHPSIVQRRMELLSSDMMTRALTLVARGQHERAHHLLSETRTILKGLGKGGLPPVPTGAGTNANKRQSPQVVKGSGSRAPTPDRHRDHSPHSDTSTVIGRSPAVDFTTMNALDAEIESSLEWINHPAVFSRDSRKAVLQAIGVISSQRAYTFRSASESLWADRVAGIKRLTEQSRDWREAGDEALTEE